MCPGQQRAWREAEAPGQPAGRYHGAASERRRRRTTCPAAPLQERLPSANRVQADPRKAVRGLAHRLRQLVQAPKGGVALEGLVRQSRQDLIDRRRASRGL
eukprot:7129027-Pyramimonas_sp.AAC.1